MPQEGKMFKTVVDTHDDLMDLAAEVARKLSSLFAFETQFEIAVRPYLGKYCPDCQELLINEGKLYGKILDRARNGAFGSETPEEFAVDMEQTAADKRRFRQLYKKDPLAAIMYLLGISLN